MPIPKTQYVKTQTLAAARNRQRRWSSTVVILPQKAVWKEALRRAHGNARLLQTVAPNSVIVWNSEDQKARLRGKVA
jgi:hypothetical protein